MTIKFEPCFRCQKPEAHTEKCHVGCADYEKAIKLNEERKEKIKKAKQEEYESNIIWNHTKKVEVKKSMELKKGRRI